jgi:hypothetical protein
VAYCQLLRLWELSPDQLLEEFNREKRS